MSGFTCKRALAPGQLTVRALRDALSALPNDAPVLTEGCDCYGDACGVALQSDGSVLIKRIE